MSRSKRYIFSFILVIILLTISTSVVFAKELTLLTISGPGMKEVALKNPDIMVTLEKSGFFDQTGLVQPPKNLNLGAGYTITAYLNLDGQVMPYVQMVYYAADQGQPGYVHYIGRLEGNALQSADQWQVLTRNADYTFRGLMSANNITLQTALITVPAAAPAVEPIAAPAVPSTTIQTSYLIPLSIAAIFLSIGAGVILRRRALNHSTM